MENSNVEIALIQEIIVDATAKQARELNDLQLAFVGGGIGDTSSF